MAAKVNTSQDEEQSIKIEDIQQGTEVQYITEDHEVTEDVYQSDPDPDDQVTILDDD